MTTSRLPPNYYTSDEFTYGNNTNRFIPHENDSHVSPNNRGVITQTKNDGSYNIIEKDFGDHKVIYHIPVEYGDNFDISALEDIPPVDEQQQQPQPRQQQLNNSPRLVRRRIIQQYNDFDATDDYEYVEEIPAPRRVYDSSRRSNDASNRTRVVYELQPPPPPVPQTIEYVYDDDNTYFLDTRPQIEEEVEYLVREPEPRTTVNNYIQSFSILIFLLFISVYRRTSTNTTYNLCSRSICTCFIPKTFTTTSSSFTSSLSLSTISSFRCS
jgi:hypothetical protein